MRRRMKWSGLGGVSNAAPMVCRSTYTSPSPLERVAAEAMGRRRSTAVAMALLLEAASACLSGATGSTGRLCGV